MSVDLVNAQITEAWQVQWKRWKPQLRQEYSRDGQSSEVLVPHSGSRTQQFASQERSISMMMCNVPHIFPTFSNERRHVIVLEDFTRQALVITATCLKDLAPASTCSTHFLSCATLMRAFATRTETALVDVFFCHLRAKLNVRTPTSIARPKTPMTS